MRIILLIPELGYGGAETALLRLGKQLAEYHSVTIVVFQSRYKNSNYTDLRIHTDLPIVELDRSAPLPRFLPGCVGRWLRRATGLRRLKLQSDVTISFLSGANLLNVLVRARRPCVLSERGSKRHDLGSPNVAKWFWLHWLDPLAYRFADRIVCVSEGLSREVRSSMPTNLRKKVITISGYLDAEQAISSGTAAIESELILLANRPLIVAAGRLDTQKGFHYLLPLFAEVAPQVPQSGIILIGDGPRMNDLINLASSLRLSVCVALPGAPIDPSAQVIFLGFRTNPARYTQLGRAFVFSSLWEGLPNLLLEALAAGSWCLAADCPWGPSEMLFEPNLFGLLPPINDPARHTIWKAALLEVLQQPMRTTLSLEQRKSVANRYSIKTSGERWNQLLTELRS
jgi:glycosyltransferase involved in cell wall biosynthesis